jgi:hypothetical protein
MGTERNRAKRSKIDRRSASVRSARRGRPPKFGRPSQLVALTLPDDVLASLRTIHHDLAWAIVRLVESRLIHRKAPQRPTPALAELVHLPGRRGLIVVQTNVFGRLRGISMIPLADGRAFLAFDQPAGLADLEVAVLDRLALIAAAGAERQQLTQILETVRDWRRHRRFVFRTKSIIVVESFARVESGSLGTLSKQRQSPKAGKNV